MCRNIIYQNLDLAVSAGRTSTVAKCCDSLLSLAQPRERCEIKKPSESATCLHSDPALQIRERELYAWILKLPSPLFGGNFA